MANREHEVYHDLDMARDKLVEDRNEAKRLRIYRKWKKALRSLDIAMSDVADFEETIFGHPVTRLAKADPKVT